MKMKPRSITILIVLGLILSGLAVLYYAFELVSVPYIRTYNAGWWVILGSIITCCGVGLGIYTFLSTRNKPASLDQPSQDQPPA